MFIYIYKAWTYDLVSSYFEICFEKIEFSIYIYTHTYTHTQTHTHTHTNDFVSLSHKVRDML
jgi:hypothetical protein